MEIEKWIEENKVSHKIAHACEWMWVVNADRLSWEAEFNEHKKQSLAYEEGYENACRDLESDMDIATDDLSKTIKKFIDFESSDASYDKLVKEAKSTLKKYS